jgi:aminopeptidase N
LPQLRSASLDTKTLPHALPGDKPQWPRDRAVDVRHIALDLVVDVPGKCIAGRATHTVAPLNEGLRQLALDAVEMMIQGVTVGGQTARFEYDGATLSIDLGKARPRGDAFDVAVTYEARPRLGLYFIAPDAAYPDKPQQVWSQGQDEDNRHWFPCYDYPNEKQTSEVRVRVPEGWFALSNGRLVEEKEHEDGTRTFHWMQERPHATYLMTLVAGNFERFDASRPDLTIDYFVEARDANAVERTFGRTPEMIALFERVSGIAFPWAKYSQIVVRDFVFGGMENTSATTMTENILLDAKAARDFSSDHLVSHELAHMWWGDLLTCRDWSHGWLNESFATFMELLWNEHLLGIDEYRQGVIENTDLYLEERYRRPIVTNVYASPMDIFDRHLYEKGSVVLHMLRGLLGDEQFFRSIQRYCREHQDDNVTTHDLAEAIERETGRNLDWFFEQWVMSPGHPELDVRWTWDAIAGVASVAVKQKQDRGNGTPLFRLPVTIDFITGQSRPRAFQVDVREEEQTLLFPLQGKPDLCRFDPGNFILKTLDFDKSLAELRFQLRRDDDIAGRIAAAGSLGKKGGPEAIAGLEEAVLRDRFWAVQAAAAKALGATGTPEAREALLRCIRVRNHKARRGVVAGLGEFRGDEIVLAALAPLAAKDPSWFVESEANRSIGKLRLPGSYAILARNIQRPSWRQLVRTGCADGLAELRDERGLDVLFGEAAYGARPQYRQNVVNAIGKLGALFPSRKAETGAKLADLLRDPDIRVRIAAANALKTLGDRSQADALDAMAARELDGRGVRYAREAAHALRRRDDDAPRVQELRDELELLKAENVKLRNRVAKIESAGQKPRQQG